MSTSARVIEVPRDQEYRFELEASDSIAIKLLEGTAECFGAELAVGVEVPFDDEVRAAIWSPTGAKLEVRGRVTNDYVATESVVKGHMAFHTYLMQRRVAAAKSSLNPAELEKAMAEGISVQDDESPPPNVMVLGGSGSGKTTLIKSLSNWFIRQSKGAAPSKEAAEDTSLIIVDLDVSQGSSTLPGSLSAFTMKQIATTSTNVGKLGIPVTSGLPVPFPKGSSPGGIEPNLAWYAPTIYPLTYFLGHYTTTDNLELTQSLITSLAENVEKKLNSNETLWKQGLLIDTPRTWVEQKQNASIVAKTARAFNVNIVVVLGSERLFVDTKKLFATNKTIQVIRLPAPDGIANDDDAFIRKQCDKQIRAYFYGGPPFTQGVLSPFSIIVKFEDLRIVRVGEAAQFAAPSSALPIGSTRSVKDTEIVDVDLMGKSDSGAMELVNTVLAVVDVENDTDDIVNSSILGFVVLTALDAQRKKVTLLSPLPGRLPRKTLIVGNIEWQDI